MENNREDLFLAVIEQNKGIIYKIASSFNKNADDKKDLAQEIILQLWRSFPNFNEESKISTWMYRVALNVAITFYRKERKKNELITRMPESPINWINEEPQDAEGDLKLLQQFINELPELDRALMLLYLEEKPGKEIGEILGITETNVRTKTNRIKEKLKQKFSTINN